MQRLNDVFQDHSAELFAQLQKATNLSELAQTATTQLNSFIERGSPFDRELSDGEQELVTHFFNPLVTALYLLCKVEIKVELPTVEKNSNLKSRSSGHIEATAGVLTSTVMAALVSGLAPAILAGLAAGGIAVFAADQLSGGRKHSDAITESDSAYINPFSLHLKPEEMQSCLKISVESFDRLTAEIEKIRAKALQENVVRPITLEEMPDILSFFQEMLGIQQNMADLPKALHDYLPIAKEILGSYKIDVVQYQHGVNPELFTRQSTFGNKIDKPIMIKPALVKEGKTLLNGVVMFPEA